MNRVINLLLLLLLVPTMLVTIFVGFDLPIGFLRVSGQSLPYKEEIFLGLGIFILIVLLRRTIRRWMGSQVVKKQAKFKWNICAGKERIKRVITYLFLEALVMTFLGIALYTITEDAWLPAATFIFGALDSLIFGIVGKMNHWFRIGLSSKALIVADREVTLLYFNGLRKVTIHQSSIYFDYIKGLQLSFPLDCIPEDRMDEFFQELEGSINKDKVYFKKNSGYGK